MADCLQRAGGCCEPVTALFRYTPEFCTEWIFPVGCSGLPRYQALEWTLLVNQGGTAGKSRPCSGRVILLSGG
ncbi:MAG: hypothetical protein FH749_10195 [Firmicutes bacterium]|nr:hypothetical protein [Bacillota bacterium]